MKEMQPYIYFPEIDVLLRTERALKYGPPESPNDDGMEGTLTLYMLLHGMIRQRAAVSVLNKKEMWLEKSSSQQQKEV